MVERMFFLLSPYKQHLMSDLWVNDGVMSWNGSLLKTFERKPCECCLFPMFPHFLKRKSDVQSVHFLGFHLWNWFVIRSLNDQAGCS